jgi:hypothetical protein
MPRKRRFEKALLGARAGLRRLGSPQSNLEESSMLQADEQELLSLESRLIDLLTDVARLRIRMSKGSARVAVDDHGNLPVDLIEIGIAAELAKRPTDTVRLWCRAHPIDAGGFAMRLRGRWFVSRRLFLNFLHDRP